MTPKGKAYSPEELALLRDLRSVERPLTWTQIAQQYFPHRSTESVKLAFYSNFPELVGSHGRGRRRKADWVPSRPDADDESDGKRFEKMVITGTAKLAVAVWLYFARHPDHERIAA